MVQYQSIVFATTRNKLIDVGLRGLITRGLIYCKLCLLDVHPLVVLPVKRAVASMLDLVIPEVKAGKLHVG